jgi:hypothetical protein
MWVVGKIASYVNFVNLVIQHHISYTKRLIPAAAKHVPLHTCSSSCSDGLTVTAISVRSIVVNLVLLSI